VYKHEYAKYGWDITQDHILHLAMAMGEMAPSVSAPSTMPPPSTLPPPSTAAANTDSKEAEAKEEKKPPSQQAAELRKLLEKIKADGYDLSKSECRLWRAMDRQTGSVSLENEMANVTRFILGIKNLGYSYNFFFNEMRFGLDLESKTTFVEVRPKAFLALFALLSGRMKSFVKKFKLVNAQRLKSNERKLIRDCAKYPGLVAEVKKYAENYFNAHQKLFDWHRAIVDEKRWHKAPQRAHHRAPKEVKEQPMKPNVAQQQHAQAVPRSG